MRIPRTVLAIFFLLLSARGASGQMKVHFINVGQADAILLEFQSAAVLIDAGTENTHDDRYEKNFFRYVDSFFVARPDLNRTLYSFILTHPHLDHTRLARQVVQRYRVRNVVSGGGTGGSGLQAQRAAIQYAADHGAIINRVRASQIDGDGYAPWMLRQLENSPSDVSLRFLGGYQGRCEDENNDSLVLLVTYREATLLFAGDAEWEDKWRSCTPQIDYVLREIDGAVLDVDLYKVGHHGSRNGTNQSLVSAMTPESAVITAGDPGIKSPGEYHAWYFGHPRENIVALLEGGVGGNRAPAVVHTMKWENNQPVLIPNRNLSKAIYCTCWDGNLVVEVDATGESFTFHTRQ